MAGELALRGVELKLFAGIGDIEVAHRELADAIGRAEGSPSTRSIDNFSEWYEKFGPVVSRME